ncbi:MAG: DUF3575 domain-containing protein [Bacteroidales bacterium]|nr:DUF3575 domain-containing protein [Bacteroidales bacterium]
MKRRHTHILTLLTALLVALTAYAGPKHLTDSTEIHFYQSYADYHPDYKGNRQHLDSLLNHLSALEDSTTRLRISNVSIVGASSPEGTATFNRGLSERRADTLSTHIANTLPVVPDNIEIDGIGRDWAGLLSLVEADPNVPYRYEVMTLLSEIVADPDHGHPLVELKMLEGGIPYRYLYDNVFPRLRASSVMVDYYVYNRLPQLDRDGADLFSPALPEPRLIATPEQKKDRPFYMALKTNMIFDALAIPNVSAEFYVGKNISVLADWMYGWWDTNTHHRYWRYYGGDLAVRWWFGQAAADKPLTGHHIGVYGGIFTFDFEWGDKGYMGGKPDGTLWDRCMTTAGIEYGYSLPVGRRLNIDFTIGFGYIGGKYIKYEPYGNGYRWLSTHRLRWVGPAKAEISLTWLIGHGNYNSKKGGRR